LDLISVHHIKECKTAAALTEACIKEQQALTEAHAKKQKPKFGD
jgi:hypothetical protein